jgi:alpha-ketoglutarate-dependent taurine dioxygenase
MSVTVEPLDAPLGAVLRGGDTLIANTQRACEALPAARREAIEGLTATHRYGWRLEIDAWPVRPRLLPGPGT